MPKCKRPKPDSNSPLRKRSKTSVEKTLDYWTEEAMAAATPVKLEREPPKRTPRKEVDDG